MILGHGGNVFEAAKSFGCKPENICDMSSNINPLGPVPGLMEHLAGFLPSAANLPEVDTASGKAAFANWRGLSWENLAAGNGTTQFIYAIPRALRIKKALVLAPTYSDYIDALKLNLAKVCLLQCKESQAFRPDLGKVEKEAQDADAVFICNPNNPTGVLVPADELARLAGKLPRTLLVVDESYLGFAGRENALSLAKARLPNVLVLISLSKIFGIAGLRAGFCHGPQKAVKRLQDHCPPWSVNALAQEAILFLASHQDAVEGHEKHARAFLKKEKETFLSSFGHRSDIRLFPSRTSFLLARLDCEPAAILCQELLQQKILIRNCSNFLGLSDHFFRVSLKGPKSNLLVRDHMAAWLDSRDGLGRQG